jgi:hypothetical protein
VRLATKAPPARLAPWGTSRTLTIFVLPVLMLSQVVLSARVRAYARPALAISQGTFAKNACPGTTMLPVLAIPAWTTVLVVTTALSAMFVRQEHSFQPRGICARSAVI